MNAYRIHKTRSTARREWDRAMALKQENLATLTPAEKRLDEQLKAIPTLVYERERLFFRDENFYFVDFFIHAPFRLGIEVDGGVHNNRQSYDLKRDLAIMDWNPDRQITMVRFTNDEVFSGYAIQRIKACLKELIEARFSGKRQEIWRQRLGGYV